MSNINNAQISGRIITPFNYVDEQNASLTTETLSIVGTSAMGPAFVPQQVLSFDKTDSVLNTWENIFGEFQYQQDQIGPLTSNIWLSNNGQQLTYTRVLGIGNGEGLNVDGHYEEAGFVVGDQPLSGSINDGVKGPNKFSVQGGDPGRTHFFGSYFENLDLEGYVSPYSDYIEQITGNDQLDKIGLITDVVFATSGTVFHLQDEKLDDIKQNKLYEQLSTTDSSQSIDFGNKETPLENPKIYLQGQKDQAKIVLDYYDNSNKYLKTNYYENLFNTTPDYHLNAGHLHYASFRNTQPLSSAKRDDDTRHFVCVGDNLWNEEVNNNVESRVNYESFECIYQRAKTPWIVSQPVYRPDGFRRSLQDSCKKLFRFHAYSDGKKGNKYRFRILPRRIGDINKTDISEKWSKFDLVVYKYDYKNNEFKDLMTFKDLNLYPKSENYIGKKVGTEREYYDLDLKKVCHSGDYKKSNNHIFVELSDDVEYMNNETDLMPSGFFPYPHMNISNDYLSPTDTIPVHQNPIQFVANMKINDIENNIINYDLDNTHWGIEFSKQTLTEIKDIQLVGEGEELFKFKFNKFKESTSNEYHFYHNYTKYFQHHREQSFWNIPFENIEEDPYNNFFHLEKILYLPNENLNKEKWQYSFYRRDGKDVSQISTVPSAFEYINIDKVLKSETEADSPNSVYLSFDFFTYGGFDGLNILDENKRKMNGISCLREYEEEIAGKTKGQTTYAYEIAKNIALDNDNFRCDIFTIPEINIPNITKELVDKSKEDSSFLYLFDSLDYDENNNLIKKNYYFNNLNNNILDVLDEDDNIKTEIILGTDNSINNHYLNFYDSEYSIATINKCEAVVDDTLLVVPSSTVFINSLSQSNLSEPIDSITYTNNIISIVNPINSKFIYNTNEFDKLLLETKKKDNKVNPIGVLSAGKKIKPLSANTLTNKRKSVFSLFHNTRIYLDIKRSLKDLLITQPIVNGETVLFSLYSESNVFSNTKSQIQLEITNLLQGYVDRNEIKDYYVDLKLLDTEKSKREKLENIMSGTVGISFKGDNRDENFLANININNLLNDISDFTAQNNINIININN